MRIRTFALTLALAAPAFLAVGCGPSEFPVAGTSRAAGMDGKAKVEEIAGGNYMVEIELEHVPPPNRLGSGLNHYVLWIQPKNQQPVREATMEFDEDDRNAFARATTPSGGSFTIIITAERTSTPTSPNDVVIARRIINPNE